MTHAAFVGLLVLLLGLGSLKQAELSGPALVVLAAALAVVGVLAFRRWAGVRTWVRYLGLAPLLFVGLFLTTSQTSDLLSSQDVASADIGPVDDPRSVVFLQFDEWPLQTLVDREGQLDSSLYPNLSAPRGRWCLVPQCDDAGELHDLRRSGERHGTGAGR